MKLSDSQAQAVKQWVSDGANIAQVQKALSEKFGIDMKYIDVRFLIDDIGAEVKNKPEPAVAAEPPADSEIPSDSLGGETEEFAEEAPSEDAEADASIPADSAAEPSGNVRVTMSPIQRPGTLAGGDVEFSDGGKAEWVLDQQGRLGLIPATKGYNPPPADIPSFQKKLQEIFSKMY